MRRFVVQAGPKVGGVQLFRVLDAQEGCLPSDEVHEDFRAAQQEAEWFNHLHERQAQQ